MLESGALLPEVQKRVGFVDIGGTGKNTVRIARKMREVVERFSGEFDVARPWRPFAVDGGTCPALR